MTSNAATAGRSRLTKAVTDVRSAVAKRVRWATRTQEEREFASSLAFLAGFALSIGLGYWGWSKASGGLVNGDTKHFLDRVYLTLQMFVLHPQDLPEETPWQLQAARLMAPTLLALAAITIITTRFRKRFRHVLFRRDSGHVIVCGAGVHGTRLAQNLAESGKRVMLVDVDEKAHGMQGPERERQCRFVADTVKSDTLISAGVGHADRLIAVAGDDVVNSQIASTVRSLADKGRVDPGLKVLIQAEDANLARFLEDWDSVTPPRIETFGANAIAADALFGSGTDPDPDRTKDTNAVLEDFERCGGHLLLAGDHPLLEAVVVASLRRGRARRLHNASSDTTPLLRITIIGPEAKSRLAEIVQRWRPEPTVVELAATDIDPRDEPAILTHRRLREWRCSKHALVACEDELEGIAFAVVLSRALGKGVALTRVRTQARNELDDQLHAHTCGSAHLATISAHSIVDLAWGKDTSRIDQISPARRLTASLLAEGLDQGGDMAESMLKQHWLGVHSDPAPRIAPATKPFVEGLLRAASARNGGGAAVPVSALVGAGLTVDLDSLENVKRTAEQLSKEGSDNAFAAWCEYARRVSDDPVHSESLLASAHRAAPLRLKAATLGAHEALAALAPDPTTVEWIGSHAPRRIAIFAGAAASMSSETERAVSTLLERALQRFEGLLITGGNDIGVCGVVRRVASEHGIPVLGYAPADRAAADGWLRLTHDGDFSEAEPVAMWADILGARRSAEDVRVVAFPGGRITTVEILLARALGAAVASLDPCEELRYELDDALPLGADGVIELPADPMTLRAFLAGPNERLDPTFRETAARDLHNQYREKHRKYKQPDDPALAPWECLLPTLRNSNLASVDDIPNKLHMVGKRLVRDGARLELNRADAALLAEMEHGRFNYERLIGGWELGEARRVSRLISPYLKPWSDLDEEVKQWDLDAVCAIDSALREAGWGVADE